MNSNTMKFLIFLLIATINITAQPVNQGYGKEPDQKIFVTGGMFTKPFIKYLAKQTGKDRPKICFLPTASADSPDKIISWYEQCQGLEVEPYIQKVWINSYAQKETFDESLLRMDAIVVGGGNTLNMLAIWHAQGIDTVLHKALKRGIILSGGSAGSLCWFVNGTTDSRPKELTVIQGLGFLNYSHSPHYSGDKLRRPLYQENIRNRVLIPGYACDDKAGILFINGEPAEAVSIDSTNHSYFVTMEKGLIKEDTIKSKIIK